MLKVGDKMFIGISPKLDLAGISAYPENCTVSDGENSFQVVTNSCPVSVVGAAIEKEAEMTQISYTTFVFTG